MNTSTSRKRTLAIIGLFYGLTGLGDSLIWQLISNWQTYFYLPPDGEALIPVGVLYGVLMTLNATIDVLITIPVGYWSDRFRTRWGRRLPWMFLSGLPRLLFFILLWFPPDKTMSLKNLLYLTIVMVAHGTITGFQQVPCNALLPELARDEQDRLTISAWGGSMRLLGLVLSGLAGLTIDRWGYHNTMLGYAAVSLALFYLPFLVLREPKASPASSQRLGIRQSFLLTLKNRAFLIISAIHALSVSSRVLIQTVFPFIVTEILLLATGDTTYFYIVGLVASFAAYPLVPWLSKKWGKRRAFAGTLLVAALILPGLLFLGDWIPLPLFALGLLWVILEAVALAGNSALEGIFIAEIIDRDAEVVGERREGMYYAAMDSVDSIVYSVIAMIPPLLLLLGRSHTDSSGPLGIRLVGVVGGVMAFLALLVFRLYPAQKAAAPAEGVS
ncbi:MAG: MFS transporter [Anaerolineae bacterium]|nr:MFS transporter [Anaerolineae bacterium]